MHARSSRRSASGFRATSFACAIGRASSDREVDEPLTTNAGIEGRSDLLDAPGARDVRIAAGFSGSGERDSLPVRAICNGVLPSSLVVALDIDASFRRDGRSGACCFIFSIAGGGGGVIGADFIRPVTGLTGTPDVVATTVV